MKKRSLFLIFASFAAAACIISGCGGKTGSMIILDGGNRAQTTALTVYGHRKDSYSIGVIEDTLQDFMSENSTVNVFYESAAEINYLQALDRRNASGKLDDVFMPDRDRLIKMAADGALADLSDAVDVSVFNEFARSQICRQDGKIYAVPTAVTTYGLYVNFDLLQRHGINEVPANLNRFTAVCNYFTGQGITPVICNNYSSLRSLIIARGMYGTYCAKDTESEIAKFNLDPPSLAVPLNDGIDFVYEMIENGWIDIESAASATHLSGDLKQFAMGETPFMITDGRGSAALKEIMSANGKTFRYSIHAFPVIPARNEESPASVLVEQTELISVKNGENAEQAKSLITRLADKQTVLKLNDGQSCFSPLNGPTQSYPDSALMSSAKYHMQKGKYVIGSDTRLTVPLDGYLTGCGKMIISGESAENVKAYLSALLEGAGR